MMQRRPQTFTFSPRHSSKQSGDGRPVLAVGRRVLTTGAEGATGVALSDENGIPTGASVALDAEVEIVAWRPRGPNGARYRVRCAAQGLEGWLDAPSVRARPVPPAPVRVPSAVVPPPKRTAAPKRRTAR